ncbi:hypothetical protein VUR80DRAFT_8455 [Thermomyces stellatus]
MPRPDSVIARAPSSMFSCAGSSSTGFRTSTYQLINIIRARSARDFLARPSPTALTKLASIEVPVRSDPL